MHKNINTTCVVRRLQAASVPVKIPAEMVPMTALCSQVAPRLSPSHLASQWTVPKLPPLHLDSLYQQTIPFLPWWLFLFIPRCLLWYVVYINFYLLS